LKVFSSSSFSVIIPSVALAFVNSRRVVSSSLASGFPDGLEWSYAERPDQLDFGPMVMCYRQWDLLKWLIRFHIISLPVKNEPLQIATILSMSPHIITLDEPDGSLDPANRNNLIRLLAGLSQTLIIATCNMNFAFATADRAVLVNNGHIIADGNVKRIMLNPALMIEHGLVVCQD